jgi:hypothetical protein
MHGDFSRTTFDPADGYRSVLLQQGRVLLDADWNEQAGITAHHDEARTRDVVGRSGGPAPAPGGAGPFAVIAADGSVPAGTAWADLRVTPGVYYVDGLLCESLAPGTGVGWPLTDQPYLRALGTDPGLPEPAGAAEGDRYALYLDVWTHHVTADEEPSLLEPALGGPDTSTRARSVWQVRAAAIDPGDRCSDLHAPDRFAVPARRLAAGLLPPEVDADPCQITGTGGYEGLENQLYRVQVHDAADSASAGTFLWSRDNGSVVARLLTLVAGPATSGTATLGLDRQGRDEELSIRENHLVEITSAHRQLRGQPGFLARAGAPAGLTLPVTWLVAAGAPETLDALGEAPIVRRWDGGPLPVRVAETTLEAGITARFPSGGRARTGDFWTIPARTVRLAHGLTQLSGTIVWPPGGTGPAERLPDGVVHHVAPLAVVRRVATGWDRESDCRRLFPPLTGLVTIDLVGGDGQEAMPGVALPETVRVVVRNGSLPVAGARLSAETVSGHLSVSGDPGPTSPRRLPEPPDTGPPLVTDAGGVARVRWLLDPAGAPTQTLTLRLLDDHRRPVDVAVVVTGRLSIARQVRWDPPCGGFVGARTVQDALAQLATTAELRLLGGDGQTVPQPGTTVPQPVRVVVDSPCGPVEGATVTAVAGDDATGFGLVTEAKADTATPATLNGTGAEGKVPVRVGADGVAAFWWQPEFGEGRSATLDVLLEGGSAAATVRVAAELAPPGARRPGLHIARLTFENGRTFRNDSAVSVDDLLSGIRMQLDGPALRDTVAGKPVVRVTLDLPWPATDEDNRRWSDFPIAYRTVTLDAVTDAEGEAITWRISERTQSWLETRMWRTLLQTEWFEPILGRFVVDGWAIVSAKDPSMHLNGHSDAVSRSGRTSLQLPTDDDVTGGVFTQWFRLSQTVGERSTVPVPDVFRRTEPVARRSIESAGLVVAEVVTESSARVVKGLALRTDPPADTEVDPGSGVVLVMSQGRG